MEALNLAQPWLRTAEARRGMNLVHNERIKYLATWLNTIASAAVILGVVTPLAAGFYGASGSYAPPL